MSLVISSRSAALLVLLVTFKVIVLRTQNYFGDLLSGFLYAKLYETWINTTKITIKGLSTRKIELDAGPAQLVLSIKFEEITKFCHYFVTFFNKFCNFFNFFLLVTSVAALI